MVHIESTVPVVGFAAYSGTGKTTLLTTLIPLLKEQGYRVGMIKHAHHTFDIDHPGKDSYRLRKAGTQQMLVASRHRWALMVENESSEPEPDLQFLINKLDSSILDCILVEGFKHELFPKIELHRHELNQDLMFPNDSNIIAIATDEPLETQHPIIQLDINNPNQIADFIIKNIIQQRSTVKDNKP